MCQDTTFSLKFHQSISFSINQLIAVFTAIMKTKDFNLLLSNYSKILNYRLYGSGRGF